MASSSFRNSMNSLGWSRREADLPASTNSTTPILSKLSFLNPFGSGGHVQLPTHEPSGAPLPAPSRREEEEGWFARKWSFLPYFSCSNLVLPIIGQGSYQRTIEALKIPKRKHKTGLPSDVS